MAVVGHIKQQTVPGLISSWTTKERHFELIDLSFVLTAVVLGVTLISHFLVKHEVQLEDQPILIQFWTPGIWRVASSTWWKSPPEPSWLLQTLGWPWRRRRQEKTWQQKRTNNKQTMNESEAMINFVVPVVSRFSMKNGKYGFVTFRLLCYFPINPS